VVVVVVVVVIVVVVAVVGVVVAVDDRCTIAVMRVLLAEQKQMDNITTSPLLLPMGQLSLCDRPPIKREFDKSNSSNRFLIHLQIIVL